MIERQSQRYFLTTAIQSKSGSPKAQHKDQDNRFGILERRGEMSDKCKFCKWYKINGIWISECCNSNSVYCGDECIEKIGYESEPCDDKIEK